MSQTQTPPRPHRLSAHNWHSWSMPPTARVPFALTPVEASPRDSPQRTAAEAVVDLLCSMGLDTYFGLPGGPIIPLFDAILTHPKARLIEPRHETYGTFAAMGYHRASGRVPVVVVTAGPGATNVVTGVVAAHLERIPMLILCGDVPWAATGRKMFQDTGEDGIDIRHMLQGVTRAAVRVAQAQSASSQVCAALRAATQPHHPGPALVVISIDRAGMRTSSPQVHAPPLEVGFQPPEPDSNLLRTVAAELHRARRPLLVIGAGCRKDAARVQQLVDRTGIPFLSTPQAKGILSEEHPLCLRTGGAGSSVWARQYTAAEPDVTLVLGTDLDDMSIAGTPPVGPGGTLIHVDTDPSVFGRNVPTAIGAAFDVGRFAAALCTHLESGWPRDGQALLRQVCTGSAFNVPEFALDTSMPLAAHRALSDLQRALGPRGTFVTDIGEHTLFALHYLTATEQRRFIVHQGLGSMGSGISSAIGLALGDPTRRVVCICGDGGMQMAGMELLVALKLRLPIVYAVFNDARYNMVYHGYRMLYSREATWETPQVDFAAWARALGARGEQVDRPGQITHDLLVELTRDNMPAVLDIRHDAGLRISNNGRVESLREMGKLG
ncbi:MAG: thiamine pyrophosphate-binding protein [Myxococcales bacterium]|nr:thiamine pyrophosphate-binding protein [Myxococcota bacterium]MDW8280654.1 thiamine pyrophosphate-binding protein [Myxococcales bacterium]